MMAMGFGWLMRRRKEKAPGLQRANSVRSPSELDDSVTPPEKQGAFTLASKTKKFSIIDHGLTVEGKVAGQGQLVVKGTIKGKLEGEEVAHLFLA